MRRRSAAVVPVLGLLLVTGIACATAHAEQTTPLPCDAARIDPGRPCGGSAPSAPPGGKPPGAQQALPLPLQMLAPSQRGGGGGAHSSGPAATALTPPPAGRTNPAGPIVPVPGD
ncbi:hypothetical protein [Nocardia paucivorans]|uniref:hypothetical protein n=1 Tax=Nocardia paucivorans TaxID=114259 RepID=UPI0012FB726C|nr:hypothetical protein [Nocardia paucivorans]